MRVRAKDQSTVQEAFLWELPTWLYGLLVQRQKSWVLFLGLLLFRQHSVGIKNLSLEANCLGLTPGFSTT